MEVVDWEEKILTVFMGENETTKFAVVSACEEFSNDSCLMVFAIIDKALTEINKQELLNDIISDFQ